MYNVLLVDDEATLVDSLYEYINTRDAGEFECLKAYSAQQALELCASTRIDIAVLDIEMPIMNGMELSERLLDLHPRCRLMFLTAYERFDYAYAASRHRQRFLLKTEGYDTLLAALQEEAEALNEELLQYGSAADGKFSGLPGFSGNDFLRMLIRDEYDAERLAPEAECFHIPLDIRRQVMPVMFHLRGEGEGIEQPHELIRAVRFFSEMFRDKYDMAFVQLSLDSILCLLQQSSALFFDLKQDLELFQGRLSQLIHGKLSIALTEDYVTWNDISGLLDTMRRRLENTPDDDEYICQLDQSAVSASRLSVLARKLFGYIADSDEAMIRQCIRQALDIGDAHGVSFADCVLRQYGLTALRMPTSEWGAIYKQLQQITRELSADDSEESFVRVALWLARQFDRRRQESGREEMRHAIQKATEYIETHYAEDISLADIARHVCLSASYLSRVYKKETGMSTVEKIKEVRIQEAMRLLENTNMKVQDVAQQVGYHSSRYFLSVFRTVNGIGPMEYRESALSRGGQDLA